MKIIGIGLVLITALSATYLVERWRWNECRKVEHGVLYCLVK